MMSVCVLLCVSVGENAHVDAELVVEREEEEKEER